MKTAPCKECQATWHTKSYHTLPSLNPCKTCGSAKHYTGFCPYKPKKKLTNGPVYKRWSNCKKQWYELFGTDHVCHYCHKWLTKETITLDHKISRGRAPELRYDFDNLVPCCYFCNNEKGSLDHDEFCTQCN